MHYTLVWSLEHSALLWSKVMQGSSGVWVKLLSNALWLSNLVGRISDQSIMHCWGQGSCRGHPGVKFLKNALWPSKLVERTPDQNVMYWCSQRFWKGQLGSTEVKLLSSNALWLPEVVRGQPEGNCLAMVGPSNVANATYRTLCSLRCSSQR